MDEKIRNEILSVCRWLHQQGLLAAADGNVSCRQTDERILITPTARNKAYVEPGDIAVITLDGRCIEGQPSGEMPMHLEVYKKCEKAKYVVHAHPPVAIAWSIARPDLKELPYEALSEVILAAGKIPIVSYARPTTRAMAEAISPYIQNHRTLILARHGALSWGETMEEAYNGIERLEHSARILKAAQDLGGITPLPEEELQFLWKMRAKLGNRNL